MIKTNEEKLLKVLQSIDSSLLRLANTFAPRTLPVGEKENPNSRQNELDEHEGKSYWVDGVLQFPHDPEF